MSFANGLQVDSWDDAFSFMIDGRIFVNGEVNSHPVGVFPPPGTTLLVGERPYLPSHAASGFSNQVGFRQVRFEVLGKAFHDWEYKFQSDFNGAPNGLVVGGIREYFLPGATLCHLLSKPDTGALPPVTAARPICRLPPSNSPAPPNWSFKGGIFSTSLEDGSFFSATHARHPFDGGNLWN